MDAVRIDFTSVNMGYIGVNEELHRIVANTCVCIDDNIPISLQLRHSMAFCDIARGIHHVESSEKSVH